MWKSFTSSYRILRLPRWKTAVGLAAVLIAASALAHGYIGHLYRSSLPAAGQLQQNLVVLDPGHGGPDPGAISDDGILEKDIVLDISLQLADHLRTAGYQVILTRTTDEDLSELPKDAPLRRRKQKDLKRRAEIINESGADAVISIHANAVASSRWSGSQVFYRTDRAPENELLADSLQTELVHITRETTRDINCSTAQYILTKAHPPAVTVEVGFLSNPREAELLSKPSYQDKLAWTLMVGLSRYFARIQNEPPQKGTE